MYIYKYKTKIIFNSLDKNNKIFSGETWKEWTKNMPWRTCGKGEYKKTYKGRSRENCDETIAKIIIKRRKQSRVWGEKTRIYSTSLGDVKRRYSDSATQKCRKVLDYKTF